MNPSMLRYTEEHEWVGEEGGLYVVGITDHAQAALGDITYVELPEADVDVSVAEEIAVVESVKAASDVYAPVSGRIVEVNHALDNMPELVNQDPYGKGWFFKMDDVDPAEFGDLMDADDYAAYLAENED